MTIDFVYYLILFLVTVSVMYLILAIPSYSTSVGTAKRLRARMKDLVFELDEEQQSILKEREKDKHKGFDAFIAKAPGGWTLIEWVEQAGSKTSATKVIIQAFIAAIVTVIAIYSITQNALFAGLAVAIIFPIPILIVYFDRNKRLVKFEEQLPEALDIMTRALRAGHAFNEALGMVGEELVGPVGEEFNQAYSDINYGMNLEVVFIGMLRRVPSVSLQAMTTAILIQRQVGGNTTEILTKISEVIRSRFRFQRKVKTLTAEGRLSGWVLALVPLVLTAVLLVTTPDYLQELLTPHGKDLIVKGLILEIIGVIWIRRLLRIDV